MKICNWELESSKTFTTIVIRGLWLQLQPATLDSWSIQLSCFAIMEYILNETSNYLIILPEILIAG